MRNKMVGLATVMMLILMTTTTTMTVEESDNGQVKKVGFIRTHVGELPTSLGMMFVRRQIFNGRQICLGHA